MLCTNFEILMRMRKIFNVIARFIFYKQLRILARTQVT